MYILILLDIGDGLAKAVQSVFIITCVLVLVSVGIYSVLYRKNTGNLLSCLLSVAATFLLSVIILFFLSAAKGALPFQSVFDVELLKLACATSFIPVVLILIISIYRFIKKK